MANHGKPWHASKHLKPINKTALVQVHAFQFTQPSSTFNHILIKSVLPFDSRPVPCTSGCSSIVFMQLKKRHRHPPGLWRGQAVSNRPPSCPCAAHSGMRLHGSTAVSRRSDMQMASAAARAPRACGGSRTNGCRASRMLRKVPGGRRSSNINVQWTEDMFRFLV